VYWLIGIGVAFLTAFYTFRMVYLTFHGEWRGPAEAWHHVHESARTMVAPLVILVVPTVLAGLLLGLPPESGQIHVWLEEVFHGAEELGTGILPGSIAAEALASGEHHEFAWLGLGGLLLLVGAAVGVGGILLARRWYTQDPEAPARFVERIPFGLGPGMYRASLNKYYFDDLYQLLFARGGVLVSNVLWWFDVKVIDGVVNGTGWLAQRIGGLLRRLQTGRVQNYGLGIAAGLVIVLLVYATVSR
jgi:NADH-quinone oxidoreductase subunit L